MASDIASSTSGIEATANRMNGQGVNGAVSARPAIAQPYLIFLGDVRGEPNAKTAFGIRDWQRENVVGQFRLPGCDIDLGVPDLTMHQAINQGARSVLIGAAPVGGTLSQSWISSLVEALEAGLDLVSGLHTRLRDVERIAETAARLGRTLHDLRHSDRHFSVASGRKRSGKRLLTVGTDCALGKKYAALAITRALRARGLAADFRATGQTGIMIAGDGIAIDAVIADFVAGAAEAVSPDAAPDHWDVIEGQGALFHPAYAGVTLALIHGSQPDALVLCHDPMREHLNAYPNFPLPAIDVAIRLYEQVAQLTNPAARIIGLSLNTSRVEPARVEGLIAHLADRHGLPCFDAMTSDLAPFADAVAAL